MAVGSKVKVAVGKVTPLEVTVKVAAAAARAEVTHSMLDAVSETTVHASESSVTVEPDLNP